MKGLTGQFILFMILNTSNINGKNQVDAPDLLMKLSIKLSIICIATLLTLVIPTLAASNATVHGEVYSSDTYLWIML